MLGARHEDHSFGEKWGEPFSDFLNGDWDLRGGVTGFVFCFSSSHLLSHSPLTNARAHTQQTSTTQRHTHTHTQTRTHSHSHTHTHTANEHDTKTHELDTALEYPRYYPHTKGKWKGPKPEEKDDGEDEAGERR